MIDVPGLLKHITAGDVKYIARAISYVENEVDGYQDILMQLPERSTPIIGFTGPPGAGKSSVVNALTGYISQEHRIAILAVDPSSPFNLGSILGDRIRMKSEDGDRVFFRSLASRGALGGVSEKTMEIVQLLKAAPFDYIFIETVGVGQSEIEIAGIADCSVLVLVPESGDQIQMMKSGIMEIADHFLVNKADRKGATALQQAIERLLHENGIESVAVSSTVALDGTGIPELWNLVQNFLENTPRRNLQADYLVRHIFRIIQSSRMTDVNKQDIRKFVESTDEKNPYRLANLFEKNKA